ncbi:lytic transglycosylase domain-containing protein [Terrarubrum flagellatum]|uniref:lytic transglycosylase domain-containing protein n=1 Tax=Terrirubrum flagellatum TaxID=2895980 RepID=UPI0031451D98
MPRRPACGRSVGCSISLSLLLCACATTIARAEPHDIAPSPRDQFRAIATREAGPRGLPPEIADAVMKVESGYRPDARGNAGEIGLMQVMPPTARLLGFSGDDAALADPETNIRLGVRYLADAWKLAGGDLCTALMKYRAGHNETRFSVLSVRYCVAARAHLASVGYPVTGEVPEPTFGFRADTFRMGVAIGTQQAARRLARGVRLKSRVSWKLYDARMKALDARARAFRI